MSALTLERLLFDPAAPADGPKIGSYIVSSSGNVIDDTSGALDVYVANTLDIDVQLDHTDGDSVKIGDGTDLLAVNGDGSINAVVTATDLDIRDLAFATDSVTAHQGGSWTVTATATDLDIRDLSHTTDSIQIGDGTDLLAVNADGSINVQSSVSGNVADNAADSGNPIKIGSRAYDGSSALAALDAGDRADMLSDLYRRIFINDAPNVSVANAAFSVDTTAGGVALGSNPAGRTRILIQNNGDKSIFVGAGTVTAANGLEVAKGATLALEAGEALALKAIAESGTQDVRVLELA